MGEHSAFMLGGLLMSLASVAAGVEPEVAFNRHWAEQAFSVKPAGRSTRDAGLPFSFVYGGKHSSEFIDEWKHEVKDEKLGDTTNRRTLILTDPATGLEVRCVCLMYLDTAGVDWTIHFTNKGSKDSPVIEQVKAVNASVSLGEGHVVIHRLNGSPWKVDDWLPFDQPVPDGQAIKFATTDGKSANVSPWFNVASSNGGVITAIGWSGQWCASVESKGGTVRIQAGMQNLHTVLHPGESIRSPRILQLHWQGGDAFRAYNLFRRTMFAHIMVRIDGQLVVPPIAHLSTSFYELNASNEQNVLSHLESIKGLGFEMFWLDAYWTGSQGYPKSVGDYGFPIERVESKAHFPRGVTAIADAVEKTGLDFLMWFEPEKVAPGTILASEHPEWVISIKGDGSGMYNLGIPEARQYMTDYLNAAIKAYKLACIRFDYLDGPHPPLAYWQYIDAKDTNRVGMAEMRCVEGLYRMWDDILKANPSLFIDNCAGGGRRIDLETMSRSIPLWRSDNTCDMADHKPATVLLAAIKNQVMSAGLNRYVPFSTAGQMGATPYLFRSGFNGGIAFAEDVRPKDYPRALLKQGLEEGKRIRKYFFGNFYPLVEVTTSPRDWCVMQYHRPEENDGMVMAFRRDQSPGETRECRLREIDPAAVYRVTMHRTYEPGKALTMKGSALQKIAIEIDERPGSALLEYSRATTLSAAITADSAGGELSLPVRFDGKDSYCPAGRIVSYDWDFGDGATAAEAVSVHTYEKVGTYTAKLTVKDDKGRANTDSIAITVAPVDTLAPTVAAVAASKPDRLVLTFSKPVRQADAEAIANYAVDRGIKVNSASLGKDLKTVTLATSPLADGVDCGITVKNVRDRARKANVIVSDTRLAFRYSGLFARWKLNEGQGKVAGDDSGNALAGSLKGGAAWSNVAGRAALGFDGADGVVATPTSLGDLALPFSLSLWVNPAAAQTEYAGILGNHGEPFKGLCIQQDAKNANSYGFNYGDGARWQGAGPVQLSADTWQHLAVVCDGENAVVYVNGVEKIKSAAKEPFAPNPDQEFKLGQGYHTGRYFRGLLSDARIYRRALTAAEVQALAKAGDAKSGSMEEKQP